MRHDHLPSPSRRRWRRVALITALAIAATLAGSCGDDDSGATTSSGTGTSSTDSTTGTTGDDGTTTSSSTTSSDDTSLTTGDGGDGGDTTLPGEPFDGFVTDGAVLAVVGVSYDDVLNIRALPGASYDVVATADPTADDLVATGRGRSVPNAIWYEVETGGATGWANASFLAYLDSTDDATAEYLDGDPLPTAETMVELGELVASGFASDDPASRITQTTAPTVGDLGEITYDVIGIGDDSIAGYRLHIFAAPNEGGEGFGLKSIERTYLCSRGSGGGLCV